MKETQQMLLVPVDFSEYSEKACDVAFRLAARHNTVIVLLHSFIDQTFSSRIQLSDVLSFEERASDADKKAMIRQEAQRQMELFSDKLRRMIKSGSLPAVKFSSVVLEGLPEEVINQFAKEHCPLMIVMGTRGAGTKEREQVGSVTAEVLDSCRYPVFTVPDAVKCEDVVKLDSVLFFSNFDQEDILALDALFHLLPVEHLNVVMVKIPGKKRSIEETEISLRRLGEYCTTHYPKHHFSIDSLSINSIDEDFSRITQGICGKLIAVPNKKKNIFARLFNPGIAHRILFHSDIPMIVIPV